MEIVVSVALLSIVMVLVVTVFMTATNIIKSNADLKEDNANAAGAIENNLAGNAASSGSAISQLGGTFSVDFNGITISIDGNYVAGTDTDGNTAYYYFDPNP